MTNMKQTADFNSEDRSPPPACRETIAQLQRVFDNELPGSVLDGDTHQISCSDCRQRIAAAKLLLMALSRLGSVPNANPQLTDKIVSAVLMDNATLRSVRFQRRVFALTAGLAIAAGVLLAIWQPWVNNSNSDQDANNVVKVEPGNQEPSASSKTQMAATASPVRLGDEFSKAEQALLGSSKPITEPVAAAPEVLAKLTDVLTRPSEPAPEFEPARMSLIDIPEAARSGLQPVTSTTQKAFARLLHDMGAV